MILLIDNYDSFVYNLYQYIGSINPNIKVVRNNEITIQEIKNLNPEKIILSPGPGKPSDAGICIDVVKNFVGKISVLGVCLGHQAICEAYGATVSYAKELMHGKQSEISIDTDCPIFKGLNKNGHIVLNGDDDKLITIKEYEGIKPVFYSYEKKDGVIAYSENVKTDDVDSVSCNIIYDNEKMDVNIKIPGKHMIYNALAATCVGKIFDLTNEEIISGLGKVTAISGRGNVIRKNNITLIDDCYNANPVSMRAGIDVLCFGKGRKVAILGDMFELGNDEKKFHAEIGEYTKKKDIDVLVFVGELMLNAFMTFKSDECPEKELYYYNTLSDFLSECKDILKDGDVVLIKASNGMKFKEIKEFLLG